MAEERKRILIVDDEPSIRDSLRLLLKQNFEVDIAENGTHALTVVDSFRPDLILLDVMMPQLDGLETLKRIKERHVDTPVVMLTAASTVKTAVHCMKEGALDYLNKPFEIEELTSLIISTLDKRPIIDITPVKGTQRHQLKLLEGDFGPMVGRSNLMESVFQRVRQVAEHDTTVLITGESGTGKELVARQIHQMSSRKDAPFIPINCAAIPETLIESELFGHERGAFTHAVEKRIGHCELADGGTLFLDEIGELSLNVQVKMLRFLQEQEFYRVGRSKPVRVNVRIIAATNKELEKLIEEKKFREDLYYRINVVGITVPPLRERYEDIPYLMQQFIRRLSPLYADRTISFVPEALDRLVQYAWPGNVRELENVIESLIALAPYPEITEEMLPAKIRNAHPVQNRTQIFQGSLKFEDAERVFETEMILKALRKTNFVYTRAAELLGISRRILKYKMDKLGITEKLDAEGADTSSGDTPAEEAVEPVAVETSK